MNLFGHKRKRIFILFFMGIVLPSLLLGYLAFRGVKNDQALVEKNRLDEQRRNAESVIRTLGASVLAVEQDFQKTLAARPIVPPDAFLQSLEKFKFEHPSVEDIFFFQDAGRIRFPIAKLLFLPKDLLPLTPVDPWPSSLAEKIMTAQRLEFEQRNYRGALVRYQQLFDAGADSQTKGQLLNAIARVQKKSGLIAEAARSYAAIARDFDLVRLAGGMPLGLAARLELGSLQAASNEFLPAAKTYLELYKILVQGGFTIEAALYENAVQTLKNSLAEIFSKAAADPEVQSQRNVFLDLENEEREKRNMTDRLFLFLAGAAPNLKAGTPEASGAPSVAATAAGAPGIARGSTSAVLARGYKPRASGEPKARPLTRLTLELEKNSYLVSLSNPKTGGGEDPPGRWGFLLHPVTFCEKLLRPALQSGFPPEETAWTVRGQDGQILMASEKAPSGAPSYRTSFENNFPNWSLEFYPLNPRFLQTLLASRQRVYFYMFLLIAGILGFGLILSVRAVSHELELAKMKSDFVSTVSHEFKSPLTSIRQLAEMLQAGRVPSEDRRRQYYDVLVEQSERLTLLIDNILSLAKIEDGRRRFEFKSVEIEAFLKEAIAPISDRVRHEGFTIEMETDGVPHVIMADGAALSQALTNLIDNAVKYSGDSRRIILRSSVQGPSLVISVKDFGQGIHKDDQNKVFDRFYRGGDPLTRSVKGSGLGLALVKEIVDAHRGKVHVESEPGAGSTFSIMLPLPRTGA
jgi:signal transduction histidine kinase